ncbi:MAG: antibiotic biosynthesis monooxygenase [Spirochaetaceae bacterium]|nr:antibiotic biosynthesis monooxygenase [Spirochaetaceae bacterium]
MFEICSKCHVNECLRDQFIQNITQLVYTSREEGGCISYELFHDLENVSIYFILEVWRNEACANSHLKSINCIKYMKKIGKTLNKEVEINKFEKSI